MSFRRFLFEWEDQPWFPARLRGYMLDFLAFFLKAGKLYEPIAPLLVRKLQSSGKTRLFDLASGGGGPVASLLPALRSNLPEVEIFLSDLYPNPRSWRQIAAVSHGQIQAVEVPVDALCLPQGKEVVFTMFSALHHFDEGALARLMAQAAFSRQPVFFCDGGGNRLVLLAGLLGMPVLFGAVSPFLRPFSVRRLLLTYLLPLVPFCTLWDGAVSVLRLHSLAALRRLAVRHSTADYRWKAGRVRKFRGVYVYYLEGTPV